MYGSDADKPAYRRAKPLFALASILALVLLLAIVGCSDDEDPTALPSSSGVSGDVSAIAAERGLTEADIEAAVKTFVPSGGRDEYILFASGGHSGQMLVIGMPSMQARKSASVISVPYCSRQLFLMRAISSLIQSHSSSNP